MNAPVPVPMRARAHLPPAWPSIPSREETLHDAQSHQCVWLSAQVHAWSLEQQQRSNELQASRSQHGGKKRQQQQVLEAVEVVDDSADDSDGEDGHHPGQCVNEMEPNAAALEESADLSDRCDETEDATSDDQRQQQRQHTDVSATAATTATTFNKIAHSSSALEALMLLAESALGSKGQPSPATHNAVSHMTALGSSSRKQRRTSCTAANKKKAPNRLRETNQRSTLVAGRKRGGVRRHTLSQPVVRPLSPVTPPLPFAMQFALGLGQENCVAAAPLHPPTPTFPVFPAHLHQPHQLQAVASMSAANVALGHLHAPMPMMHYAALPPHVAVALPPARNTAHPQSPPAQSFAPIRAVLKPSFLAERVNC